MKYIFTLLLFLFISNTFSQKIDGIGKFKIDKTSISVITDIEKEIKIKCGITSELDFVLNKNDFMFKEILLDSIEIRLFYLSEYVITNIKLTNIYLIFYHNSLIQLRCNKNKELDAFLTRKYGRPIIYQKTIPNIKNEILDLEYDESYSKYTWINNNIIVISFERKQFFDGIVREAESYFKIFDRTYNSLINRININ